MNIRHKAREIALQILYKVDIAQNERGEVESYMESLHPGTEARRYCEGLVSGVMGKRGAIDGVIEGFSENWKMDRMAVVDRNVLRLAVYELLYVEDVPFKVVIDEAVELAKRYGSDESGAFINGVLDKVHREAKRPLNKIHAAK
jgi:transcription antitermination protein NusB